MLKELTFFVPGHPAPGGSKRGFAIKKGGQYTGRVAMIDAGGKRNRDWRSNVATFSFEHMKLIQSAPLEGALFMSLMFYMPRPKYHFNKSGIKSDAPTYHTIAPDCTKLFRSTEDAMAGIVFRNDCQVVTQAASKFYGDQPGCQVTIMEI